MICVDASVAAKWIFEEELYLEARALYREVLAASRRIVAPPLLPMGVTNVVRQRMRRAKYPAAAPLSQAEAHEALERFLAFPIDIEFPRGLQQSALDIAIQCELPAVYDAHYVALAKTLDCEFWTADRNLVTTVEGRFPRVRWIGKYVPGAASV